LLNAYFEEMIEIGKLNQLRIVKEVDFGLYLDGKEEGEILLPRRYVDESFKIDDYIEVFIYNDSEDRIIATTDRPYGSTGEIAYLKVISVSKFGAFLDWGLAKDLLVPFSEQKLKMIEGKYYLVYIYLDNESRRIVASAKLDKFLDNVPGNFTVGEQVEIIVAEETEIGYKSVINNLHWGLIYKNEINQKLGIGEKLKAYISNVREDDKIDISLYKPNIDSIEAISLEILKELENHNGYLPYTDKSDAEIIYRIFGISKKNFKKTIGNLYRRRLISLESDGIRLNSNKNIQ
jgi:uncharacterized protein